LLCGVPKRNTEGTPPRVLKVPPPVLNGTAANSCPRSERRGRGFKSCHPDQHSRRPEPPPEKRNAEGEETGHLKETKGTRRNPKESRGRPRRAEGHSRRLGWSTQRLISARSSASSRRAECSLLSTSNTSPINSRIRMSCEVYREGQSRRALQAPPGTPRRRPVKRRFRCPRLRIHPPPAASRSSP
jgi:hypothetical protein